MEDNELIKEIYQLSTESKTADERLSMQFEAMDKRIETLEKLSASMAENLNDLKHLQTIIDSLSNIIHQHTTDIKELKTKYYELEQKPTKAKAEHWQYITDTIFKTVIGAILGFILFKVGVTK